jgi:hypothetical protein
MKFIYIKVIKCTNRQKLKLKTNNILANLENEQLVPIYSNRLSLYYRADIIYSRNYKYLKFTALLRVRGQCSRARTEKT